MVSESHQVCNSLTFLGYKCVNIYTKNYFIDVFPWIAILTLDETFMGDNMRAFVHLRVLCTPASLDYSAHYYALDSACIKFRVVACCHHWHCNGPIDIVVDNIESIYSSSSPPAHLFISL